ncbi:MAG: type ISP restriction/modification enzyme, partial [Limisphaerales bacterium]
MPSRDNPSRFTRPILQDFIEPASEAGAGVHVKNLYNDYVYFWRWALWKLFENPDANGAGIITFITAASYLRGPGFVGMRQKMREAFDELWIIDLEGDNLGARKTENVFAIQTPVAIAIGVRYENSQPQIPAKVHYTKITGTRDEKYGKLNRIQKFADLEWRDCFNGWTEPF